MRMTGHVDTFAEDRLPPAGADARVDLRCACRSVSGADQRGRLVSRPSRCLRRCRRSLHRSSGRGRLDLRGAARRFESNRTCARRRSWARARQSRVAARAEHADACRMLVRRPESGRHRRDDACRSTEPASCDSSWRRLRSRYALCDARLRDEFDRGLRAERRAMSVLRGSRAGARLAGGAHGVEGGGLSQRRRPRPKTWRSSPLPPAPPVRRRPRCIFTATCWQSAIRTARVCCSPPATIFSAAARRWRLRSG